ncbi:hypothetical protein AN958_10052 [Leucoagaricus sp. SymC.cos]|nr:hypothetical protein AN958_10052 [Leucoagaricus sp. SymC.cos]
MKLRTRRAIRKFYSDIVLPSIDATDSLGFVGFMSAGLVQALGGLLNMKWVVGGFITGGSLCQVQGHLKQIGDVSITLFRFYALSSLYIAFDTFLVLVFSWRASRAASIGGLISICLFIALVVAPGSGINRGKRPACVGDIDYWCWITKEYNTYRIDLEYLWMWMATLVMLTLYGFIALVIHGSPIVEGQRVRFRGKDNKLTHGSSKDENMDDKKDNQEIMKLMLFYPAVYILCVLPVSVICWIDFTSDDTVPTGGIIFTSIMFQSVQKPNKDSAISLVTYIMLYAMKASIREVLAQHVLGEVSNVWVKIKNGWNAILSSLLLELAIVLRHAKPLIRDLFHADAVSAAHTQM